VRSPIQYAAESRARVKEFQGEMATADRIMADERAPATVWPAFLSWLSRGAHTYHYNKTHSAVDGATQVGLNQFAAERRHTMSAPSAVAHHIVQTLTRNRSLYADAVHKIKQLKHCDVETARNIVNNTCFDLESIRERPSDMAESAWEIIERQHRKDHFPTHNTLMEIVAIHLADLLVKELSARLTLVNLSRRTSLTGKIACATIMKTHNISAKKLNDYVDKAFQKAIAEIMENTSKEKLYIRRAIAQAKAQQNKGRIRYYMLHVLGIAAIISLICIVVAVGYAIYHTIQLG